MAVELASDHDDNNDHYKVERREGVGGRAGQGPAAAIAREFGTRYDWV